MEDALALKGEEGRDKLRKAPGSGKYTEIRRFPNGATRRGSTSTHANAWANVGN